MNFSCPACHTPLILTDPNELRCPNDDLRFERIDGVWRFLLPERAAYFEHFIRDYETVRRAEGRGPGDPAYYRALPYQDLSRRMAADWKIRAVSFDLFQQRVLIPMESPDPDLAVLDLGAGNGWLSNRLALRGHRAAAVDLLTNDFDGLGCHRYYETSFTPVQAEFERLPFRDGTADLVVFNASLHYAVDFGVTLAEALRVLAPDGRLVILDSPIYHDPESGAQMVKEREIRFTEHYGFASNALPSKNYLTYHDLNELASSLHLFWQIITPSYGFAWALKPLKARLLGRREPAKFHLVVGRRESS